MAENKVIRPRRPIHWHGDSIAPTLTLFNIGESEFYGNTPRPPLKPSKDVKKSRLNPLRKTVTSQLKKYCENTTLHGLRYVGDSHLTFGERIFWFVSFSMAIGFAAYYITNIYDKWKTSPVIISFSPFDADLSSIPFPAVTICNMNQAKKDEAEKILAYGSRVEQKLLDDACNGNTTFDDNENVNWETLKTFLVQVGNNCTDILKYCMWGNRPVNCDSIFNNELTDEGLCCSFNRLPPEKIFRNMKDISILNQTYPNNVYDWDPEKGYTDLDFDDYIPRRPLGAGAHLGLTVILDAQIENYYCSSTSSTGFKVILANPIETPKMADFGFLISPGFETRVTIDPSIREASHSLRNVPINQRQCYFSNERPLQYYRHYSMKNCKTECLSKASLRNCGCVPYFLPRNSFRDVKICGVHDICPTRQKDIIDKYYSQYRKVDTNPSVNHTGTNPEKIISFNCNCLHACYELDYKSQKSFSELFSTSKYTRQDIAVVKFHFLYSKILKTRKRIFYSLTDLIALTGGLLGFFTGFSLLSAMEVTFYLIWLLWKKYWQKPNSTNQTVWTVQEFVN